MGADRQHVSVRSAFASTAGGYVSTPAQDADVARVTEPRRALASGSLGTVVQRPATRV